MQLKTKQGEQRLDPYVKVCYQCFSADWKLVKAQHTQYLRFQPPLTVFNLTSEKYFCRTLEECFKNSVTPLGYADAASNTPRSSRAGPGRASVQITRNRATSSIGGTESSQNLALKPEDPHFQYVQPWTDYTDDLNQVGRVSCILFLFLFPPSLSWCWR